MVASKQSRKTMKTRIPSDSDQMGLNDSSRRNTFPIVGIGASAGGLEALTSLLKALSPDLGMAFIFVPHLDPSRESAFTQILARTTAMPVLQIADGTRLKQNHVYVIPPNCDLTMTDATLHIKERNEPRSVN